MRRGTRFLAFALLCATTFSACGGDNSDDEAIEPGTVILRPASFEPKTITIRAGESVTWTWREKVSHNIVGKGIDKKPEDRGSYIHIFREKGTFDYRCTIHPGMDGSVVVE